MLFFSVSHKFVILLFLGSHRRKVNKVSLPPAFVIWLIVILSYKETLICTSASRCTPPARCQSLPLPIPKERGAFSIRPSPKGLVRRAFLLGTKTFSQLKFYDYFVPETLFHFSEFDNVGWQDSILVRESLGLNGSQDQDFHGPTCPRESQLCFPT